MTFAVSSQDKFAGATFSSIAGQNASQNSTIDVLHYDLHLRIEPTASQLEATAHLTILPLVSNLASFELNLEKLTVRSLTVNGETAAFQHHSGIVYVTVVQPADTFFVSIDYGGTPGNDGFGGFVFKNNHVYTVGQGLNSDPPSMLRYWAPCRDVPHDKATLDMHITVPAPLQAFANGLKVGYETDGVTSTFHWREALPIAPYLIALAVGDYVTFDYPYISPAGDSLPIQCCVFPHNLESAKKDFANLPQMMRVYEDLFLPYPFARYSMVEADNRGAMEHQTMPTYSTQLITGDNRYDYIVAHELAHHWWGNLVTCGDWKDIWLNEGFATYAEALYFEKIHGFDYLVGYMNSLASVYFTEVARRGHFTIYNPLYKWGGTVYQKGAWVLHMLRRTLGDDDFFKTLRTYAETYAYGNALTGDFIAVAEKVSGKSLTTFFDQWLYQPGYPDLDVAWNYEKIEREYRTVITVKQNQWDRWRFHLPLEIVIVTVGETIQDTLQLTDREQRFEYTLRQKPVSLQIDPDCWLLIKYNIIESPSEPGFPPNTFVLAQNYPNPFLRSERTQIVYQTPTLGAPHHVSIRIYNLLGQRVRTLLDAPVASGINTLYWDGADDYGKPMAAGVYLLRLSAADQVLEKKITLLEK